MDRLVPEPPRLAAIYRRLARLPAGSSAGMACASAGFACVLGLLVIGPSVGLPSLFRERTILGLGQAPASPRSARARETAKPDKAKVQIVLAAVVPPRTGGGQEPASATSEPATPAPTTATPTIPEPTAAPTRSPEAEWTPTPTPEPVKAGTGSPSPAPSRAPRRREEATPTPGRSHEPTDDDRASPIPTRSPDR